MRYYKITDGEYILGIGTGLNGVEIDEERYEEIMEAIRHRPARTETTDYRLREDLSWEAYDAEPEPEPEEDPGEEVTAEEIAAAIQEAMA